MAQAVAATAMQAACGEAGGPGHSAIRHTSPTSGADLPALPIGVGSGFVLALLVPLVRRLLGRYAIVVFVGACPHEHTSRRPD